MGVTPPRKGLLSAEGRAGPFEEKPRFPPSPALPSARGQPHPPFRWVREDAGEIEPGEVTRLPVCVPRFMDVRTWRS